MRQPRVRVVFSWTRSLLSVAPAFALMGLAAVVGPERTAGGALMCAAAAYLIWCLGFLQPRMARAAGSHCWGLMRLAVWYHERLGHCQSETDIAALVAELHRHLNARERTLLLIGGGGQPVRVLGVGQDGDATAVHTELINEIGTQAQVLHRDANLEPAVGALLKQLDYRVALPLRHDKETRGLALLEHRLHRSPIAAAHIEEWLRVVTSMGLARLGLGFEAAHRLQLRSFIDYARATQEALMPDEAPTGVDGFVVHGVFRPAAQCGGDLWIWRQLGPGRLLLVIGDVTGHGVAPAMLSAAAAGAIQGHAIVAGAALDPAALLGTVSRSVYRIARAKYMITAFAAIIDRNAGVLHYANAGHPFPYLIDTAGAGNGARASADNGPGGGESNGLSGAPETCGDDDLALQIRPLVDAGPILGSGPEIAVESHRWPVAPGSRLVLFTDGIIEAEHRAGGSFGGRRLRATLKALATESAGAMAPRVLDEVYEFANGRTPSDDMTIVVVDWPSDFEA